MAKVFIEESTLTKIGNAIRSKTGKTELIDPAVMDVEITSIEAGSGGSDIPEEAFTISGDCVHKFRSGGWDWFIKKYGYKITTKDISNAEYMFYKSSLDNIPFDLNFSPSATPTMGYMFSGCKFTTPPKLKNAKPKSLSYLFQECENLREVPEEVYKDMNWSSLDNSTSSYGTSRSSCFASCSNLRVAPIEFLSHDNSYTTYGNSIYPSCFCFCYALDEIVNMPNPYVNSTWSYNAFSGFVTSCMRLKNLTFALQEDGTPHIRKWKSQTIDLSSDIGYGSYVSSYTDVPKDKEVKDDATYQSFKNDPDWWTKNVSYSRYNHDSAVATINSLPDTSAYLATAGGTNTIKFKGTSGSLTDGGAINTLTAEEIAVATAKGWTVTLV